MKKSYIAALALVLTLGIAASAFAWPHGGGHGGHSAYEHGGYAQNNAQNSNIPFNQHNGGHEFAENNATIHEAEMKDPNHTDGPFDYTAPHKVQPNCEGMTGPHGRHIEK